MSGQTSCFGDLDTVFPMGGEGLREVAASCWGCAERVECLRMAVAGGPGGGQVNQEMAAREEQHLGGMRGFLRRWNRLKTHQRREG